ncbi:polysaccharide biosynthesis/export family protein [Actibacterium sp. 188UL27-1]|uniref:polysaccharide biosynthesis/export family protein n=1 Tax=Actibacterium sp. 188UL27-1 TaxID=2786961 RepID=UPI00195D7860|nr:polysaccharide biosynthesis/export family protein [Actibacterium sp. 188UL27-1]MBM7068983.1 polysaccharide biosynthesis/export family protein [Actibacterium sp. 188UL27-1]
MRYLGFLLLSLFFATAATAQGSYGIQPGDSLQIEVVEDNSLNRNVLVTPDGQISFPLAGTVNVNGRTVEQVRRAITSRLAPNFANPPTVFVAVSRINDRLLDAEPDLETMTIYLLGEVSSPGPKQVEPGLTILQFLSTSGGFTKFAATKRVQIRRRVGHTEKLVKVNYNALSRGARLIRDVVLHDGDVILVPERRLFE